MYIGGLFTIVSKFDTIDDPVVICLVGKFTKDELTEENINYIKSFYHRSWCTARYVENFPDGFEPSCMAVTKNYPNGYLVLEPENYKGYELHCSGKAIYPFKPRPYDDASYYYAEADSSITDKSGKYNWYIGFNGRYKQSYKGSFHEIVDLLEELNGKIEPSIIHN